MALKSESERRRERMRKDEGAYINRLGSLRRLTGKEQVLLALTESNMQGA